ncbi:MAG: hypothetical protein RL654_2329 [Pseudomonadota bacterium]
MKNLFHPSADRGWAAGLLALGAAFGPGAAHAAAAPFQLLSSAATCEAGHGSMVAGAGIPGQSGEACRKWRYSNVSPPTHPHLKYDILIYPEAESGTSLANLRANAQGNFSNKMVGEITTPAQGLGSVAFRVDFVEPGTTTLKVFPTAVSMRNYDTDGGLGSFPETPATSGSGSMAGGGLYEQFTFIGAEPVLSQDIGAALTSTGNGSTFMPKTCGTSSGYVGVGCSGDVAPGADGLRYNASGQYAFFPYFNGDRVEAQVQARYAHGASVLRFAFGVFAHSQSNGWESSRIYGIGLEIPDGWVDMIPEFSNLPAQVKPKQTYVGLKLTCHNRNGTSDAQGATCLEPTVSVGKVSAFRCASTLPTTLASQGEIQCTFDYTAPDAKGQSEKIEFTGKTRATQESRTDNNTVIATVPMLEEDAAAVGALSGRVWVDLDHDLQQGSGEPNVSGVKVEVLDSSGVLAGAATTDADGDYRVSALPVGLYTVRFSDAVSGAYYGRPVSRDPAGGNDPSAAASTGQVAARVLSGVSVVAGVTRIHQSLPLDPSGVVYDSGSRALLGGAAVELLDASGRIVAASCLVGGANKVVTTGSGALAGYYSFLLNNPAPSGCPGAGTYQLRVTPSAGYVASTLIPAQTTALTPPSGCATLTSAQCAVQAQSGAPTGSESTAYYLSMNLDPARGPDIINNHIPLDPATRSTLLITKTGDRKQAEIGDSVRYTLTVRRADSGGAVLPAVEIIDTLPAGFRYIAGTAMVGGTKIADPEGAPGPVLRFQVGAMAAGDMRALSYRVRLGTGSQQGTGINRAQACGGSNGGSTAQCSNVSQFRVTVTGGVFSTEACVVGRIFVDCNHDHVQGPEELGIPGVRLVMSDATTLISDVEGKYSACGLTPHTLVMTVDGATLPRGSRLIASSNRNAGDAFSLFLDLKSGELHRADFIEGSCSNTVLEQVKARRARGETTAVETEKRRGRVLKLDGKHPSMPAQATDSADQRGTAAGQGEPGAMKPRQAVGTPSDVAARTETSETLREPVSANPASSGATPAGAAR